MAEARLKSRATASKCDFMYSEVRSLVRGSGSARRPMVEWDQIFRAAALGLRKEKEDQVSTVSSGVGLLDHFGSLKSMRLGFSVVGLDGSAGCF